MPRRDIGIPLRVRLHAALVKPISGERWRAVWVRYWESQGIPEARQMEWAAEESAREEADESRERGSCL
jgi:hypothetical protein